MLEKMRRYVLKLHMRKITWEGIIYEQEKKKNLDSLFLHNLDTYTFFNINLLLSSKTSTSFDLTLLHLIYSSYYNYYISSLCMSKPPNHIFYYIFYLSLCSNSHKGSYKFILNHNYDQLVFWVQIYFELDHQPTACFPNLIESFSLQPRETLFESRRQRSSTNSLKALWTNMNKRKSSKGDNMSLCHKLTTIAKWLLHLS